MIYRAIKKDLGTGSITGDSQQSYQVPYYVITDNTEDPHSIYEQARSAKGIALYALIPKMQSQKVHTVLTLTKETLPVFGTVTSNLHVSDIRIERSSENNLRSIPGYGLAPLATGSYTCWIYTVTFSASTTTWSIGSDAPWNSDTASSCTWSPKTYERYDNKTLVPNYSDTGDTVKVPNYPLYKEKYKSLVNTVGDALYRDRIVYNYLLNFTYAVRNFDAEYLPLYLGSMNLKDCVVAGIPIKKYHAVINDMRVTQAEWNGKLYYNVDVEIEVQYQQRLMCDEYMASGHRAYMIEGSTTAINSYVNRLGFSSKEKAGFVYKYTDSNTVKKYPVPIEELTDIRQRDKVPNSRWFMKKKNLGYFEDAVHKVVNTETVPISRRVFITSGSFGGNQITVSFRNPNSTSQITPSTSGTTETLYKIAQKDENEYTYSLVSGSTASENVRTLTRGSSSITVNSQTTTEYTYLLTKDTIKHRVSKEPADPLQGQYTNIQNPVALNKFGGIYFADEETSVDDNTTNPAVEIDMYDPMLGKAYDYQHVARDWRALDFPKKGMFHSSGDGNTGVWTNTTKGM